MVIALGVGWIRRVGRLFGVVRSIGDDSDDGKSGKDEQLYKSNPVDLNLFKLWKFTFSYLHIEMFRKEELVGLFWEQFVS